jgi:hypothetical protein
VFLPALGFRRDAQIEPGQYDAEKLAGAFFASSARGGCLARCTPIEFQIIAETTMLGTVSVLILLFTLGFSSVSSADLCHCVRRALHMTTPTMRFNAYGKVWCSRVPGFVLCALLALLCSGCLSLVVGAAGGAAGAVYVMGKLQDEVSYKMSVVHSATVAALAEQELKLLEDKVDKLSAHVESECGSIWNPFRIREPV